MTLDFNDNAPLTQPKPYAVNERLSAEKLNETLRVQRGITTGIKPPRQVIPKPLSMGPSVAAGAPPLRRFSIQEVKDDYLICNPVSSDGVVSGDIVRIAKPWTLRTLAARNFVTYNTYTGDGQYRNAVASGITERQVVVPHYFEEDIVFAATGIAGGTDVTYENESFEIVAVNWLDVNVDARAWARQN